MDTPGLPPVTELVALANSGSLYEAYKDRPDAEKIAVMARLAGQKASYQVVRSGYGPALQSTDLLSTIKVFDLTAARVVFSRAAASRLFLRNMHLPRLVRGMERAPAGTFHDAELRRVFRKMKGGEWYGRWLDGLDLTRRIESTLGIPETANLPISWLPDPAVERALDIWMDTWTQLLEDARAANGQIDPAMRRRWHEARRMIAANPEFSWQRDWMDLDTDEGQTGFRELRLSQEESPHCYTRDWLAHGRAQEFAWRKLGPVSDWSTSAIPGVARLAETSAGPADNLLAFLRTFRGTTPNAAWSRTASALAKRRGGASIRRALIAWLGGLAVAGHVDTRVRLWQDVRDLRRFRRCVLADIEELRGACERLPLHRAAEAAALTALFDFQLGTHGWWSRFVGSYREPATLSEVAALLVRAAVWMLACWRDAEVVATLQRSAELTAVKCADHPQSTDKRSLLAANACVAALGTIATAEAVQALGRIKLAVRDERLLKQIAKAMEDAARRAGVTVSELEELAVPTFDLDAVGVRVARLGELSATLRVKSSTAVAVELAGADGRMIKSAPAAIRNDPAAQAQLKQLRTSARSIAQALPVHRNRIEQLYLAQRTWPLAAWRERFLDHPLVGTLARRLIWTATNQGQAQSLIWHADRLVDATGTPASGLGDDCTVSLWHPLDAAETEVAAWRAFLVHHKVTQPFRQAHRELYPITDAERATGTYSNRFAGHILRQQQCVALARQRGWRTMLQMWATLPDYEPPYVRIPAFGLAAEFCTEHAGGDDDKRSYGPYRFVSTDRVLFRRLLATGNGTLGDPVPLEQVPARIFSEVMRDADLFVSVASIGNDPSWLDHGTTQADPNQWRNTVARDYWTSHSVAALDVAGRDRRQLLAELIPSLAIANRCSLEERHLTVRGRLRSYRIHLGSGNVMMQSDRYLCIVPGERRDALDVFLPFEGDRMLSIILSKAVMLAADDKIADPSIVSQLGAA